MIQAGVDSGFTGGVWLPRDTIQLFGVPLIAPLRYPRAVDGRVIRGRMTVLAVQFVGSDDFHLTPAFSPAHGSNETLVGEYLLAQVNARLVIYGHAYTLPPAPRAPPPRRRNRAQSIDPQMLDLSGWVLPTHRAVTPWWSSADERRLFTPTKRPRR